jgi:hypothetical protein
MKPNDSITKNNKLMDTEEFLLFVKVTQKDLQSADDHGSLIKGAYSFGRFSNDYEFKCSRGMDISACSALLCYPV